MSEEDAEYIPLGPQEYSIITEQRKSGRRRRTLWIRVVIVSLALSFAALILWNIQSGDKPLSISRPLSLLDFGPGTYQALASYDDERAQIYRGAASIRPLNEKMVLMYKTGHSVIYNRLPMHFVEVRPDIPHRLIYSDVAFRMAGFEVIDALANFSKSHSDMNEFSEYRRLQAARADGMPIRGDTTQVDWDLDRFKFAPLTTHAWKTFPNATWYITVDGDSYLFWSTLVRWLDRSFGDGQTRPWYLGYDEVGDPNPKRPRYFAHGGAGYAMSQGLLQQIYTNDPDGEKFINDKRFDDIRCGDCAIGDYIADLPGHNGHTDGGADLFHHDGLDKVIFRPRLWHTYVLSLHHVAADTNNMLRQWEKSFLPTLPEWDGVRQCDLFLGLAPALLREGLQSYIKAHEPNVSTTTLVRGRAVVRQDETDVGGGGHLNEAPSPGSIPARTLVMEDWRAEPVDKIVCDEDCLKKYGRDFNASCDMACDAQQNCYGWELNYRSCTLAINGWRIGSSSSPFHITTAWRLDRIAAVQSAMPCLDTRWRARADLPRYKMGLKVGRADQVDTGLNEESWRTWKGAEAAYRERGLLA
ncbi:hypothetical protein OC845_004995 [Tilletia horrida]|nr:hypothetical protein OC845_004995 [Tilletia horrida]